MKADISDYEVTIKQNKIKKGFFKVIEEKNWHAFIHSHLFVELFQNISHVPWCPVSTKVWEMNEIMYLPPGETENQLIVACI